MTRSSAGVPVGRAGGDITLPPSSKPSSSREVSLQSGGTSPTGHSLSQEEHGTARAGAGAGRQLRFHGFLPRTQPAAMASLAAPTASQSISPMNTRLLFSYNT